MVNWDEVYEKFCQELPDYYNLSEEQQKNVFDLVLRLCYNLL